jgi:hypothetical protein
MTKKLKLGKAIGFFSNFKALKNYSPLSIYSPLSNYSPPPRGG